MLGLWKRWNACSICFGQATSPADHRASSAVSGAMLLFDGFSILNFLMPCNFAEWNVSEWLDCLSGKPKFRLYDRLICSKNLSILNMHADVHPGYRSLGLWVPYLFRKALKNYSIHCTYWPGLYTDSVAGWMKGGKEAVSIKVSRLKRQPEFYISQLQKEI